MPNIIEGYNYDIFISYRQKDNKHDGWVSEFVNNLKGELESTFKEEISVYFDINPHDGLLETHDVDESLKEKLKCLIFIPIISRTYCDPKSFAWEHEFKVFVELASRDPFGLKVKLPNGNVASRVLPVRIHDLDIADIKECESVISGVLRGVDFIYKSSGVNRPLRAIEDHPQDNLNKTYYRDQINKVANAIKEAITAIEQYSPQHEEVSKEVFKPISVPGKNLKTTIIAGSVILLALIILGFFFVPKLFKPSKRLEKSIAVLPFRNDSPVDSNKYFINGFMEEVLNNLQTIKDFRVLSRTSTEQYQGSDRPTIPEIAKKLGVNYIVEGSGQKIGNTFRLRIQLIKARGKETHLWANSYEQEIKKITDIFKIQSQVAQSIAEELRATITPEENQIISKSITTNLRAYDLFFQARNEHMRFWMGNSNIDGLNKAMILYRQALQYDSIFAQAYSGLALGYWNKYYAQGLTINFVDSVLIYANKAVSYNDKLDEAHFVKGIYFNITGDYSMALKEFNEAIKLNPNYSLAYYFRGDLFLTKIFDQISGFEDLFMTIQLEYGPSRPSFMRSLGALLGNFGYPEMARYYIDEALKLDNDSIIYFNNLAYLEYYENPRKAIELLSEVLKRDPSNLSTLWNEMVLNERLGNFKEALHIAEIIIKLYKARNISLQSGLEYIGYAFLKTGDYNEAKIYFDKQISISENILKLDPLDNKPKLVLAKIYATLGKKEQALQLLTDIQKLGRENRSKEVGIMPQVYFYQLKYEPMYENLLSEPMFQNYINEVESNYKIDFEKLNLWMKNKGVLKE